jgi:hypothetical protein
MARKCEICGSCWPAMVTLEAFNNYRRMDEFHPESRCRDEDGEFGPKGNHG